MNMTPSCLQIDTFFPPAPSEGGWDSLQWQQRASSSSCRQTGATGSAPTEVRAEGRAAVAVTWPPGTDYGAGRSQWKADTHCTISLMQSPQAIKMTLPQEVDLTAALQGRDAFVSVWRWGLEETRRWRNSPTDTWHPWVYTELNYNFNPGVSTWHSSEDPAWGTHFHIGVPDSSPGSVCFKDFIF